MGKKIKEDFDGKLELRQNNTDNFYVTLNNWFTITYNPVDDNCYYYDYSNDCYDIYLNDNYIGGIALWIQDAYKTVWIQVFQLDKKYRKQGIGKTVIKEIKNKYPGYDLCVNSVPKSKGFWEKLGFKMDSEPESEDGCYYGELKGNKKIKEDIEAEQSSSSDALKEIAQWIAGRIGNCIVRDSTVFYIMEDFEIYDFEDWSKTYDIDKGIFFIIEVEPKNIKISWPYFDKAPLWKEIDNHPVDFFTENKSETCHSIKDLILIIDDYMGRDWFGADDEEVELYDEMFKSIGKDNVEEDIEDEVDDAGYIDIESLIEDEGIEAFSPENIEKLKSLGQIDKNGNLMDIFIEPDIEEVETSVWDLERLYKLDYKLIEADYVKQLLINEVKRGLSNSEGLMRIDFKTNDLDVKNYSELSQDFVEKCFEGEVFGEFGYDYETDISYIDEDLLRSEKIDRLFSVNGLPEDSLILVKNGEVDEDENPRLAKYADELENAMRLACTYAEEAGAELACLDDFEEAFNESVPDGCSWNKRLSDNEERCIDIDERFIIDNLKELWDTFDDYYSSDAADNAERMIKELINVELGKNFREPYSGWYGFSEDTFVDCLMDNLYEINFEEEPQEEKNLLNFNGEDGEYHEDLLKNSISEEYSKYDDPNKLLRACGKTVYHATDKSHLDSIFRDGLHDFWFGLDAEECLEFMGVNHNDYTKLCVISIRTKDLDPKKCDFESDVGNGVDETWGGTGIYYGTIKAFQNIYDFDQDSEYYDEEMPDEELNKWISENNIRWVTQKEKAIKDVDEDIEAVNDKSVDNTTPLKKQKNIYYMYFTYNKELSAKTYRLDGEHILAIAEWAREHNAELLDDIESHYDLENLEDDAFMLMSKIKPSYASSYKYSDGYTLWGDDWYYSSVYLGNIPKEVGDKLVKGKGLYEELSVCCVPGDFPYDDILVNNDRLEDLLQKDVDTEAWGVVNADTGELLTDLITFGEAWEIAKSTGDIVLVAYLPDGETDLDIKETEDKIQFVPIALIQNEK